MKTSKEETRSNVSANDSAISLSENSDVSSSKISRFSSEYESHNSTTTTLLKPIKTSNSRRSSRISTASSTVELNSKYSKKLSQIEPIVSTTNVLPNEKKSEAQSNAEQPKKRKWKKARKQYICKVCDKHFLGSSDLRKHLLIHSDERPFECEHCRKKFRQHISLKNHIASIHDTENKFPCTLCKKSFPIKERLRLHMRLHSGEKPYRCTECMKCFARGGQLRQHIVTHTGGKKYACESCSATFSTRSNLRLHLQNHSENIQFRCEICEKYFSRADILRRHLNCYHSYKKTFHCHVCKKTLKGHLYQHLQTHQSCKQFNCDVCEAQFSQKCQLNVHLRMHSGERPFRCRVCWQAFAHSSVLKLHIRKHTGEKPFPCLLCKNNTAFSQLAHLKTHMRSIHNQTKPYMCEGCNNFFKIKMDLKYHTDFCEKYLKLYDENKLKINQYINISNDPEKSENTFVNLSKMRLLIAVVLKKISTAERLQELGFDKRLIDNVVTSALKMAKRKVHDNEDLDDYDRLKLNIKEFLEWTIPESFMKKFKKEQRSILEILEDIATAYSKTAE